MRSVLCLSARLIAIQLRQSVETLRKAVADPRPQMSNEKYSEMYTMALAVLRCLDALDPKVCWPGALVAHHRLGACFQASQRLADALWNPLIEYSKRTSAD